jgi:hypothetical protein
MGLKTDKDQKRYLYILKDGKLHEKAEEGAEGAKLRVHEKEDGTSIEKWEYSYPGIVGFVTDIKFYESDYGTNILVDIKDEDENEFVLSLKANSRYGESFMEALPNLDLTKEVDFTVYSFPDKKNKDRRVQGVTIKQDGEKIKSYFKLYDEDTKTYSYPVKGYPTVDQKKAEKYNNEKWKLHFASVNIWLQEYLVENDLIKPFVESDEEKKEDEEDF